MTRLTNDIRNEICESAITASFKKQNDKLKAEETKIGMQLYRSLYKKSELDIIAKLDKKWLDIDECLRFNCGGFDLTFCVEPGVAVPQREGYGCRRLGNITDPDLVYKAQDFAKRKEDAKAEERKAEQALRAVLFSVNTVKRLAEVWPEGAAYYDYLLAEVENTGVPAIKMQELNAMLGLSK